jgi:hypothetical protein
MPSKKGIGLDISTVFDVFTAKELFGITHLPNYADLRFNQFSRKFSALEFPNHKQLTFAMLEFS